MTQGARDGGYFCRSPEPFRRKVDNRRGSHLRAGLYAGPHYYLPLPVTGDYEPLGDSAVYRPDIPLGVTFGISVGWRAGPGNIFVDGRFEYDGFVRKNDLDPVFRNSFKVNIGYEWGIGNKKAGK